MTDTTTEPELEAAGIDPGAAWNPTEGDEPGPARDSLPPAPDPSIKKLTKEEVAEQLRKLSKKANDNLGDKVHADLNFTETEVFVIAPGGTILLNTYPFLRKLETMLENPRIAITAMIAGLGKAILRIKTEREAWLAENEPAEQPVPAVQVTPQPAPAGFEQVERVEPVESVAPAGVPNPLSAMAI